jgi:hypothetical protein
MRRSICPQDRLATDIDVYQRGDFVVSCHKAWSIMCSQFLSLGCIASAAAYSTDSSR